jgi:hypothetical protein
VDEQAADLVRPHGALAALRAVAAASTVAQSPEHDMPPLDEGAG